MRVTVNQNNYIYFFSQIYQLEITIYGRGASDPVNIVLYLQIMSTPSFKTRKLPVTRQIKRKRPAQSSLWKTF